MARPTPLNPRFALPLALGASLAVSLAVLICLGSAVELFSHHSESDGAVALRANGNHRQSRPSSPPQRHASSPASQLRESVVTTRPPQPAPRVQQRGQQFAANEPAQPALPMTIPPAWIDVASGSRSFAWVAFGVPNATEREGQLADEPAPRAMFSGGQSAPRPWHALRKAIGDPAAEGNARQHELTGAPGAVVELGDGVVIAANAPAAVVEDLAWRERWQAASDAEEIDRELIGPLAIAHDAQRAWVSGPVVAEADDIDADLADAPAPAGVWYTTDDQAMLAAPIDANDAFPAARFDQPVAAPHGPVHQPAYPKVYRNRRPVLGFQYYIPGGRYAYRSGYRVTYNPNSRPFPTYEIRRDRRSRSGASLRRYQQTFGYDGFHAVPIYVPHTAVYGADGSYFRSGTVVYGLGYGGGYHPVYYGGRVGIGAPFVSAGIGSAVGGVAPGGVLVGVSAPLRTRFISPQRSSLNISASYQSDTVRIKARLTP